MSISRLCVLFVFSVACGQAAKISPVGLTTEHVKNPTAVDEKQPRLSWFNEADARIRGETQTAYQIRVASDESLLAVPDVWLSEVVPSNKSNNVQYAGNELQSGRDYWWQVRVWDKGNDVSAWSEPAYFGMGLLNRDEWKATWIGAPWQGEEALPEPPYPDAPVEKWPPPAPLLRREFSITKEIVQAKAFVTGLGYFEFYVNGKKVGDDVLVPNQTNYGKRPYLPTTNIPLSDDFEEYKVYYLVYDISDHLKKGENVLGAILGNGFYNASKYWSGSYGSPRFLGQIEVEYADGTSETIVSDESWKVSKGPITMDMVYYGEHYDARLEQKGWSAPGFEDNHWERAAVRDKPHGRLEAQTPYGDQVVDTRQPVFVELLVNGNYLVDFGEEVSGWVRLKQVQGASGHKIALKFHSNLYSGENTYICNGEPDVTYAPRFNWFVFSKVEVESFPGELQQNQIEAQVVNTFIESNTEFETSNPLFNEIHKIWRRSQLGNMHGGVASDCPHRERSAYTGDGQVACATVLHNFDARSFYRKWIADVRGSQIKETGYMPNCAPWQPGCGGGVAWGAAVTIMPWEYYLHYGDEEILLENYQAMKDYVKYMTTWADKEGVMHSQRTGKDGKVLKWFNLGDWACVDGECPPDELVHTFYYWQGIDIVSQVAQILGREEDFQQYNQLKEHVQKGFYSRFYNEKEGSYGKNGGNVFALFMGVPERQYPSVIRALRKDIANNEGHLDTGIFGTKFFFEVLADHGMQDLAYEAMNKKSYPSFGYWIADGATTTREHWDNKGSHNHPMFGGGITWFYRKLAGFNADINSPGYRKIIIKPQVVSDLTFVKYKHQTVHGEAMVHWTQKEKGLSLKVKIPVGCEGIIHVPSDQDSDVLESGISARESEEIGFLKWEDGYNIYGVKSGEYQFTVK